MTFLIAIFVLASFKLNAQNIASREYQIKAAFLYNFTQFVEWPETSFPHPDSPFVIGILGDDPFGGIIDQIVNGEKVKGHPIIVRRFSSHDQPKACHILYIAEKAKLNFKKFLPEMTNNNILTVSDIRGFAEKGGVINFVMVENKTKLTINPAVARAANLKISAKLLRVAEIVGENM